MKQWAVHEMGVAYWARAPLMLALAQYAEAEATAARNTSATRATHAMLRYALCLHKRLRTVKLAEWAQARWQDIALGIQWLLDHDHAREHASDLRQLLSRLHAQGVNWEHWFQTAMPLPKGGYKMLHGVNNAQALKSAAVLWRQRGDPALVERSRERVARLDEHCALPTGMWVGDENMPTQQEQSASQQHHPARGAELCGVVEAMYSFSIMFGAFGDPYYLERLERIALNALPATWASPRGGEMIAHQVTPSLCLEPRGGVESGPLCSVRLAPPAG